VARVVVLLSKGDLRWKVAVIFVTVGSTDFDPLIAEMDKLAVGLGMDVVMQIGAGRYVPQHAPYFRFAPSLDACYDQAELVVGHGGLGTIVEALERGKKLICVVNPTTYDRHQEHLLGLFEEQEYLVWCREVGRLGEAIQRARSTQLKRYEPPECTIHEVIADYLLT
jgi:UDP-N-acetylglucosamine transferase subunit ALG13